MAATPSTMVALGTKAPDFTLENVVTGGTTSLQSAKGERGTLIMFICNHCPYVINIRPRLLELCNEAIANGIAVIAISSNDIEKYPQDGPELMKELAESENWAFPYLLDRTQEVAHAYSAACTPDFFLFDKDLNLYYRGQFDDSRPKNDIRPTGDDLKRALDALAAGNRAPEPQIPSLGCNIKWLPGNEPRYF